MKEAYPLATHDRVLCPTHGTVQRGDRVELGQARAHVGERLGSNLPDGRLERWSAPAHTTDTRRRGQRLRGDDVRLPRPGEPRSSSARLPRDASRGDWRVSVRASAAAALVAPRDGEVADVEAGEEVEGDGGLPRARLLDQAALLAVQGRAAFFRYEAGDVGVAVRREGVGGDWHRLRDCSQGFWAQYKNKKVPFNCSAFSKTKISKLLRLKLVNF